MVNKKFIKNTKKKLNVLVLTSICQLNCHLHVLNTKLILYSLGKLN